MTIEVRVKAERSRHLVLVTVPEVGRVGTAVWDLVNPGLPPGVSQTAPNVMVVCADHEQAAQWAAAAPAEHRAHAGVGSGDRWYAITDRRVSSNPTRGS